MLRIQIVRVWRAVTTLAAAPGVAREVIRELGWGGFWGGSVPAQAVQTELLTTIRQYYQEEGK